MKSRGSILMLVVFRVGDFTKHSEKMLSGLKNMGQHLPDLVGTSFKEPFAKN
jgi:hypothetical protein